MPLVLGQDLVEGRVEDEDLEPGLGLEVCVVEAPVVLALERPLPAREAREFCARGGVDEEPGTDQGLVPLPTRSEAISFTNSPEASSTSITEVALGL